VEAINRYGEQDASILWRETNQTIRDMVSLIQKSRLECGFHHTGAIMVAKNELEETRIDREHAALAKIGLTTERLSGGAVENSFRGTKFTAGLSFDVCSVIHPAQFTAELSRKFSVPIYEKTPMTSFKEQPEGVTVQSPRANVICDRLILATNLEGFSGLERHFAEETTVVLASEETSDIHRIWPEDKVIWTMEEKYDILYPLGKRLALELYQARQIKRKLAQYYAGVNFEIQHRWGDSWSKTADLLPLAGPLTNRVYAAMAMGDEGIVMGFTIGSRMHLAIEGRSDPILKMTSPRRFNP